MIHLEERRDGRTLHLTGDGTFADFFQGLGVDPEPFQERLRACPFQAVSWELPPLVDLQGAFECVLLDHPLLASMPVDRRSFADHFSDDVPAVRFANLRGDSELIAPCPRDGDDYPHLLAWARLATPSDACSLWSMVADAVARRLQSTSEPTWVSTAGMGVGWLHVRLDPRPKYYRYAPYKRWP